MTGIVIEGLTFKRKERFIFNELSVTIPKGQFIGLLGPNGTGKSTLLKMMVGLLKAQGHISINGKAIDQLKTKEMAKLISYMPQSTQLETNFTVEQVVQMGRFPHKTRFSSWSQEDTRKVEEAFELTGISHLKERFVPSLSGGERQLVYLAKVIAQDTEYILLDEPTSDLDVYHQVKVTNIIHALVKKGKTVLAAIHDINFSTRICEQSLLLKDGIVIDFGNSDKVLTKENMANTFSVNAHIYVEEQTGAKQMIPLEVKHG